MIFTPPAFAGGVFASVDAYKLFLAVLKVL